MTSLQHRHLLLMTSSLILNQIYCTWVTIELQAFVTLITTAMVITMSVKELYIPGNGLTSQVASSISDMISCLEVLHIENNELGEDGAQVLSEETKKTKILKKLKISNNQLKGKGAMTVAHNTSLEFWDICSNNIGQSGAKAIASLLTHNICLKHLDVSKNDIDKE